jgi:hypothetical protein
MDSPNRFALKGEDSRPRGTAVLVCLFLAACGVACGAPQHVPTGVVFDSGHIYRSDNRGDNWCITWAADDSQITSMCDGNWLGGKQSYHNHLYRIIGAPDDFSREDIPNYPQYIWGTGTTSVGTPGCRRSFGTKGWAATSWSTAAPMAGRG